MVSTEGQPYRGVALRAIAYLRAMQLHVKTHGAENSDYFFDSAIVDAERLLERADVVMREDEDCREQDDERQD